MRKILIIEDDHNLRVSLRYTLEDQGYDVETTTNGKDGLEKLQSCNRPRLVLCDLMMPIMNGWEFVQRKNQHTDLARIPVILISALAKKAEIPEANDILEKPINVDLLIHKVRLHCNSGGGPSYAA